MVSPIFGNSRLSVESVGFRAVWALSVFFLSLVLRAYI